MALSSRSITEAKTILWQLFPQTASHFVSVGYGDEEGALRENTVVGYDPKADGGYENVFANIRNLQQQQIDEFGRLAESIHNSTFCRALTEAPGVTRIGWF